MSPTHRLSERSFDSLYAHGFARVAAAVPEVRVADPAFNAERTIELARRAADAGAALIVFPELGLSAYSNEDLFRQQPSRKPSCRRSRRSSSPPAISRR